MSLAWLIEDGRARVRLAALISAVLVASVTAFGSVVPAAAVNVLGPDFEIDGDLDQDDVNFDDWETVLLESDSPGVHIPDPHSKAADDLNVFNSGGKFYDTSTWNIGAGNVGAAQNELVNVALYPVTAETSGGDDWLVLSLERTKKQGTFALWFELNQNDWVVMDDDYSTPPTRSENDVAVGFELSGNPEDETDFEIAVLSFDAGNAPPAKCTENADGTIEPGSDPCPVFAGDWHYRFLGSADDLATSGVGAGQMNLVNAPTENVFGWDSFTAQGNPRDDIGPFQFAEAAINLTELGVDVECPGFGSAHAASVASLSPTADAKDLAGPRSLPITCSIEGTKYNDLDVDGQFDASDGVVENWPMYLYADDGNTSGQWDAADSLVSGLDANPIYTDENGDYAFTGLSDGTYHVVEGDAPQGGSASDWIHQAARTTDGSVVNDGNGDPTIIEGIMIDSSNTKSVGNDFLNAQPPDVRVSKSATNTPIEAGDDAEFSITVTNDGPGTATGVSLSDNLPTLDSTTWSISSQPSGNPCSISGSPQVLACSVTSLGDDASFTVKVKATTTGEDCGTIPNTATVSATNEPSSNVGTENSDSASIVVNCPDISVDKTGSISYTASVTNDSSALATADGVTLSDELPAGLSWTVVEVMLNDTEITNGDYCGVEPDDPLTAISCSGIELDAGDTFSVTVEAGISDSSCAPDDTALSNSASATASNEANADTANNGDSANICAPAEEPEE